MKQGQLRIFIFTYLPSPYQVELFDALAASGVDLFVLYACRQHSAPVAQRWSVPPLAHAHAFADLPGFQVQDVAEQMERCDLYIMNYYRHLVAMPLLRMRLRAGKPWCFWGERPGVRFAGLIGRLYRTLKLWPLHRSRSAIWGIGSWAVEAWRRDFGNHRAYHNVPYFSDLSRFVTQRGAIAPGPLRLLFSGSLIERKGVDLLAQSFVSLAQEFAGVHLTLAGVGPLQASLEQALSGCRAQVDFRGFIPWEDLPAVYARADLLCVPSRYDGWAMVVPEGLAAGLPVISSDHTGAAYDLIQPDQNGWIIPANEGGALLNCLRKAAAFSPERRAAMRSAALASVARHQLGDGVVRFMRAAEASMAA